MRANKHHNTILKNYGRVGLSLAIYIILFTLAHKYCDHGVNPFVVIPLITAAFVFGLPGGIALGILAHPLNITLHYAMGERISADYLHLNALIAWGSLLAVGVSIGYLKDLLVKFQNAEAESSQLIKFPSDNPNPVLRIDNNCVILYANPASALLLETWQTQVDQRLPSTWCSFAQDVFTLGESQQKEIVCGKHTLSLTFAPIIDTDYINIYGLDITTHKQTEQDLRDAKKIAEDHAREAEAANQAKSAFLANITHELRTPLNAILGFSELMMHDANLTAVQRNNIKTIANSGGHLLALINDVLELSKIEAGRIELSLAQFDLHKMLSGLKEMFQLQTREKGLALIFELEPNTPQCIVADEQKLYQVLVNLLGNAVKFTDNGHITLRVTEQDRYYAMEQEQETDTLHPSHSLIHFEVEDTGFGISPEELEAVFDTFVQTESGKRSKQGTGLGIPISRRYVRMMGGELTVESQFGQGTCFAFDIQVEIAEASQMDRVHTPHHVIGIAPDSQRATDDPYRILIAEDVDANRALLMNMLKPFEFELQEARNGQQALEIWKAWHPHLILMDIRMPVMDGKKAIHQIRATPEVQQPIIIAVTASPFSGERDDLIEIGCDDFIRKPLREAQIFEILTKYLGVRFIYEESAASSAFETKAPKQKKTMTLNLEGVSSAWISELHQAALEGDIEWMKDLVTQIQAQHPVLAKTLMKMIYNFEHEAILAITESQ